MKQITILLFLAALIMQIHPRFPVTARAQQQAPAPVVAATVKKIELRSPVTFVGTVRPIMRSRVSSEIEGLVIDYPVEEGQYVKKGDVLSRFNTRPISIQLEEARASRKEAEARYELANKNYARFKDLHDRGVASLQQMQDAESEKNALKARIDQLQSRIEGYQYDLQRSALKAPFNGFISKEFTEVGQWINEGDPVVEIINIDQVDIVVDVPERYSGYIVTGTKPVIFIDALPGREFSGVVKSIIPQSDERARTFPVKVRVNNDKNILKSGMAARVGFNIGKKVDALMVPKDAIVLSSRGKMVFVVENGSVRPVPVQTSTAYKDLIQVNGDLVPGQLVVIRGNERLRPGQSVNITNKDELPENKKIQ